MSDYYESIAQNVVRQWKDWLSENGHLYGDLAVECEDMLVDLIAVCLEIRSNDRKEKNDTTEETRG
jgi:hypothetical protein